MILSAKNIQRIKATALGTATNETGMYGSRFFALLKCIDKFGEPITTEPYHKLHGQKALPIGSGEWVAIHRKPHSGNFETTWYILEKEKDAL